MFSSSNYYYDAAGQLIEFASRFAAAEAPDRTVKSKYDKYGRLAKVVYDDSRTEEYVRDTWGKILKVTAIDGETMTFIYDAANQLVTSMKGDEVTNYAYDAAGRLVKSGATEYSYGWMDKVLTISENEVTTKEISYYLNGQVAKVNDLSSNSLEAFTWDDLALIQRNAISYLNEPAVTGGSFR